MSSYVHGSRMSYQDYLQTKQFVDDVRWDISQANLNAIATNETLQKHGIRLATGIDQVTEGVDRTNKTLQETNRTLAQGFGRLQEGMERGFGEVAARLDDVDRTLVEGFITLHSDLMSVESSVQELSAKFEWGFSEVLLSLGSANESLAALVKLARTPEQTWAFEQYEIARDAFRRGLYREALDYVERAISGHQGHTGYSIEHRFHALLGVIRLGSYKNNSPEIVSEQKAYDAFQRAARYAMSDYGEDAARALCGAAQAAYCLGRFDAAEAHAAEALRLHPTLPEAAFALAKTLMHVEEVDRALPPLAHAIRLDSLYALKLFDDADFTKHEPVVRQLIETLRVELADHCNSQMRDALTFLRGGSEWLKAMVHDPITVKHVPAGERELAWLNTEHTRAAALSGAAEEYVATNRLLDTVIAARACAELVQVAQNAAQRTGVAVGTIRTQLEAAPDRLIKGWLKNRRYPTSDSTARSRTVSTLLSLTAIPIAIAESWLHNKMAMELAQGKIPAGESLAPAYIHMAILVGLSSFAALHWLFSERLDAMFAKRRDERLCAAAPSACGPAIDAISSFLVALETGYRTLRNKLEALTARGTAGWALGSETSGLAR